MILFKGDEGPLVIAFQLTVAEQPFAEAWRAGLADVVKELDRDESGTLSREETETTSPKPTIPTLTPTNVAIAEKPTTQKPRVSSAALSLRQTANLWDADAEPHDGQLTLEEIARFLARQGRGAFQTKVAKNSAALLSPQVTQVSDSGERLWSWLDANDDSQISTDELRNANKTLAKHDLDADETISLNELEGNVNPFFSARRSNQETATPFFALSREQSLTPIVRDLIQHYMLKEQDGFAPDGSNAAGGESRPSPKVPGVQVDWWKLTESERKQFDRDGNGVLDHSELRAFLKNPVPMVTIEVQLPGSGKGEPKLAGQVLREKSAVIKHSAAGTLSILSGEIQIEIETNGLKPEALKQSLNERFKQLDRDNNGYLEQNEANRDPFFNQHFKKYDADGDGKLFAEEWTPPVEAAIKYAQTRTRMEVQDNGQDVFTVLDGDRNLKISPREWLTVADRLGVWDKNENGTLERSEVPHVYRVSLSPGLPDLPGLITPQNNNNGRTANTPQLVRGPKWFRAMDKNADGDVSAREFLGKPDVFGQIDQDKNNLIDPIEAAKFSE